MEKTLINPQTIDNREPVQLHPMYNSQYLEWAKLAGIAGKDVREIDVDMALGWNPWFTTIGKLLMFEDWLKSGKKLRYCVCGCGTLIKDIEEETP
jgi:hypothetical protein